jgi:hypothetical protein
VVEGLVLDGAEGDIPFTRPPVSPTDENALVIEAMAEKSWKRFPPVNGPGTAAGEQQLTSSGWLKVRPPSSDVAAQMLYGVRAGKAAPSLVRHTRPRTDLGRLPPCSESVARSHRTCSVSHDASRRWQGFDESFDKTQQRCGDPDGNRGNSRARCSSALRCLWNTVLL